ncbi:serine/threonine-protein kinase LMTK1 [Salvelinus namaycush]|uniref:non-specific serine/threonine protein kinase n=1 Tax=Salvelinus namaycush TaxID=8040 RepID=A0A8U0QLZ7_SALNM|nr:serine/threonine-protein kinase LMTK1 [Salvelinus namaycush]
MQQSEVLFIGTKSALTKAGNLTLTIDDTTVSPPPPTHNLGVILDSTLSFEHHMTDCQILILLPPQHSQNGAPLSGLSWPSSLAVVAVSLSGLFTFVFLMLACLCCKKGHIGFKEFENVEGEEYQADLSTLASPASQGGPDVYILPLTKVSLPMAKQPGRSVQLLKSTELGRHSLLYLKEIGDGWFGKVLLGEVNAGLSTTQVVVKELKASASVQDQMHFLEEAQPYRALQHPALLQCLVQCTDVTPYLLVMEFCPLGDVKGYMRSCRAADTMTPEPLILQRMACEIASGLLHLHKHNFIHSDLALRNCLLTADVTVKIGDYGLSHNKYKDDYFVTSDQMYVPLRWIAPELIDEVHGNLLVVGQSKQSNVWSLGVTIWELFELGNQPYRHYSDRQVLTYAVREQQLRLPKPLLNIPLAERWYEVMQFCWLQPDQRPNAEEVHLLLSYLCAKGANEAEEDFERRWNSLRPNPNAGPNNSLHHGAGALAIDLPSSSFPLLEQFSGCDGYHSESGDDILTVTETSHGLNFEYKWEKAQAGDLYYPPGPGGMVGGCGGVAYYEPKMLHGSGVGVVPVLSACSPSVSAEYYVRMEEPGVDCHINMDLDYTMCSYSPDYQGSNGSFLTGSGSADSGDCIMGMGACPSQAHSKPVDSYWSADICKAGGGGAYDSDPDGSPAISLTMEPLLGQVSDSSPLRPWEAGHYVSYKDRDGGFYYEHSPPMGIGHHMGLGLDHHQHYLMGREHSPPEPHQESWGSRSLRQALGELENPLGISPSISTPPQGGGPPFGVGDPYLETTKGPGAIIGGSSVTGGYYDMMGSLRKTMPTMPGHTHSVSITMASEDSDEEEDIFSERQRINSSNTWPSNLSNHCTNNNSLGLGRSRQAGCRQQQDAYVDFLYTMPTTDIEDSWPEEHNLTFRSSVSAAVKPIDYLEATAASAKDSSCLSLGKHHTLIPSDDAYNTYIYLCHEREGEREVKPPPIECCHSHFVDPLTGLVVRNYTCDGYRDQIVEMLNNEEESVNLSPAPGGPSVSKSTLTHNTNTTTTVTNLDHPEQYVDITMDDTLSIDQKQEVVTENKGVLTDPKPEDMTMDMAAPLPSVNVPDLVCLVEPESELSHTLDSGLDRDHCSSISLVDISDCYTDDDDEDDDITDVTSGIFADEASAGDLNASPSLARPLKSLQKQVGTPDSMTSMDSMDLMPLAAGSTTEPFSPASSSSHPSSSSPKAMDSGYDTENNESPEFILKEPHNEPRDPKTFTQPLGESVLDTSLDEEGEEGGEEAEVAPPEDEDEPTLDEDVTLAASQTTDKEKELAPLSEKNPYRDSAYFSDYENERLSRDDEDEKVGDDENVGVEEREEEESLTKKRDLSPLHIEEEEEGEEEESLTKKRELSPLHIEEEEEGEGEVSLTEKGELSPLHIEEEEESLTEKRELSPLHIQEEEESLTEKREHSPLHIEEELEGNETSALLEESEDPEMKGCLTEECTHDEGLELGIELASNISGEVEEGSEGWLAQEEPSSLGDWAAEVVGAMEEALGELQRSSSTETNSGTKEEEEEEGERRDVEDSSEALELADVLEEASSERSESIDKDDDDEENGPPSRRQRFSSSSPPSIPPPPLPPMTPPPVRVSLTDRGEADEEDGDGDSDDSESDEELRSYSVQEEQSGGEESEEENHAVPIVVSDCSDAHNLRSLLKVPTTLTSESLADDLLERKKKVVSFFDDVTVYLFDQQSPTKELAEHGFPPEPETSGQGSEGKQPTSDDSSDGNISEESAGYEWEDDFPLLPLPTSISKMAASSSASTPSTPSLPSTSKAPEPKPAVQYSRFTVSPSHVSRFSITHVSDSDIDSGPGSSEDGDRE